ncbi:AhpC/TSA family protein [Amycolatopsis acidiphila]|uniref:AhpC/TSA family protein n=1 Tax=Amycolatopsis acidiphila TaxID=715473 RepID=A0A557ZWU1_9PSEU|nr:peroxiredoxin-like family protein [Amycolatopsis acidiphila]TVT16483.1 AhpC/TSA family protein [Amycolatopsis acidiphila]UIJ60884.1 AhpC/TSA family protein [Amycolatopsis acidiphila]GHG95004.1 alkyl hydroperoxide reductase [Amycolatopsis acidiphila]
MRKFETVTGEQVTVPDPDCLVHLQFRRFAGCPVCNLHLQSVLRRHDEIVQAGVREVVFFHSPADELRKHVADLPFAVIADPDKRVYAEYGVDSAPRALLDPRVWGTILRAVCTGLLRRDPVPSRQPVGGRLGLPADFLIAPDGRVVASKHGVHAYDQWPVDEIVAHADEFRAAGGSNQERTDESRSRG